MSGKISPGDSVKATNDISIAGRLDNIRTKIEKIEEELESVRYFSSGTLNKVTSLEAIMNTKVEHLSAQITEIKDEKTLFKRSYLYPVLAGLTLTALGSIGTFVVVVGKILSN